MNTLRTALASKTVSLGAAAGLAILGLLLLVLGWPEQTQLQRGMMQLSALALSLAMGAVLGWIVATRAWLWERRGFRMVGMVAAGLVGLGILICLIALVTHPGALGPLGLFFIWMGFGVIAIYLMMKGIDAAASRTETRPLRFEKKDTTR